MVEGLIDSIAAAKFLGVSRTYLYRATQRGIIPSVRIGKKAIRYDLEVLRAWAKNGGSARKN